MSADQSQFELSVQQSQGEIWQTDAQRALFAQLCNAFYAREIARLASEPDAARLRRLMLSLPYYIERAATRIVNGNSPLELDANNGSWLAKQKQKPPQHDHAQVFYQQHAKRGLIVPVLINNASLVRVRIDSVDQLRDNALHCNEHGWFDLSGEPLEQQSAWLLKPSKEVMTAACCGHQWHFNKRIAPTILSLREMLLASNINWRNLKRPLT